MTDDPKRDDELAAMLRTFDRAGAWSDDDMQRLARRIDDDAASVLAQQAGTMTWWEYPVAWARPLLSFGATAAVIAALLIAWAATAPPPAPVRITDAQTLLNALVAPVENQLLDASHR